jgi:ComF family protein
MRVSPLRRLLRAALDLLLPPCCPLCRRLASEAHALCASCWGQLEHIASPQCVRCGHPFEYEAPGESECLACLSRPPQFARGRAALSYNETAKRLVFRLKFCGGTDMAPMMAEWMLRAGKDLLREADLLVPVPLHRARLLARQYNQAALLARRIGKRAGVAVRYDVLKKTKRTGAQSRLSRKARERNLKGAFLAPENKRKHLEGKNVLLVDDVYTTGATADRCARALRKGGAAKVCVLTLCKTPLKG